MSTQSPDTNAKFDLPEGHWRPDTSRSEVGFAVRTWWGLVNVKGRFTSYDGTLEVGPEEARIELRIQAASLDTRNRRRDEHLRSPDFFDAEQRPTIVFRSDRVEPGPGETLHVDGTLTVGQRSVQLQLPVEVSRLAENRLGLATHTTVSRGDFGLTWNRRGMIRDDAHLHIEAELTKAG